MSKRVCLDFNHRLLCFFGIWPGSATKTTSVIAHYWRKFVVPFQLFRITFTLLFHLIVLETLWTVTHHRVHEFVVIFGMTSSIVKLCTILFRKESIAKCFQTLEELSGPDHYVDEHCEDIKTAADRFCAKFAKYTIVFVTCIPAVDPTFLYRQIREVYELVSRKHDWLDNPVILWTTIVLLMLSTFDMTFMGVADNTYLGIAVQITAQFRILRYKMENLRELTLRKLQGNHQVDLEAKPDGSSEGQAIGNVSFVYISLKQEKSSDVAGESTDHDDDYLDSILGILDTESDKEENEEVKDEESDLQAAMETSLRECIRHHEILIEVCKEFQRLFQPMLAYQMALTVMLSVMGLYIKMVLTLIEKHLGDHRLNVPSEGRYNANNRIPPQILAVARLISKRKGTFDGDVLPELGLMFAGIFEFFYVCKAADNLTQASAAIFDAAYACDWIETSERFKRTLKIFLARTIKPVVLKGAGVPLSMPTFKKIVKASHYVNSMMTKMMDGEKLLKTRGIDL